MSSGMNTEQAKEYAGTMTYRQAISNVGSGKFIKYRKATMIKLRELAEMADRLDRKTEPTCDTCRHKGVEGCEQPCLGCGCCGLYEAMTENDKLKEKVVEFIKSCARCKHRPIGAMMCEESCRYEPKTEPQTEREGE